MISILSNVGVFSKPRLTDLAHLSRWAFLLTFAGVGLQTNFGELREQRLRPLAAGTGGEFAIAGLTLALLLGANRMFGP